MLNNVDDPYHWLKLAQETRALAHRVSFDAAKKRLLELAKDYDRIAARIHERLEKAKAQTPAGPPVTLDEQDAP